MKYGFGIDLGGTTVKLAYFSAEGQRIHQWEIPTDTSHNGSHILTDIAAAVQGYLTENAIPKGDLLGIGIGVPGPVDDAGVVNKCVNLGWGVFNIQQALEALTGLPVRAGNDANVAALGEYWMGGGQGCENMVFATLGTGVGGGIIIGGKMVSGAHGAAGEIGHMVLNPQETEKCGCGKKGCVEQYCSATGIVRLAKQFRLRPHPRSAIDKENLTCKDIFDAAAAGDGLAQTVLARVYDYMGQFLANICCVVNPQAVVIGGGVSKAGQPLLEGTKGYFDRYVFHGAKNVRFSLAALGNDAGAYGAFKLILDAVGDA